MKKPEERLSTKKIVFKPIFNIILGLIFLILGIMVKGSKEGILFDMAILGYLHTNPNPVFFSIMKFISFIGSEYFLFPAMGALIVYMLYRKRYRTSIFLLTNTLGSFIANHLLKQVFQRTRPLDFMQVKQGGLSYPSGHSMVTMSMYLAIGYLLTRAGKREKTKPLVYSLIAIMILSMGLSRMYLGVHWPTDIIGGYIGGYLFYYMSLKIYR